MWSTRRAVVGLGIVLFASAACGGDGDEGAAPSDTTEAPAKTSAPETSAPETSADGASDAGEAAEPNTIILKLIQFKPTELAVAAGTEVTWLSKDVATHTVTSGTVDAGGKATSDGRFDSGDLKEGGTFKFTFDEAGEYPYYCSIHPATMTGVVRVK